MKSKINEKQQAIALRKIGHAMGDISARLDVSKSSVSLWTRDVPYVPLVKEEDWRKRSGPKISETKLRKLLEADFDSLTIDRKKKRVVLEQQSKCLFCGISDWQNKPITLAVDHVDGNNQNDSRDNLRGLCPNCHSQTDTFCGKDRGTHYKKGQPRVTDERLLSALLETKSMSEALRSLGMSRGPKPFQRCKDLLQKHNAILLNFPE